jgi:hypothetical protein
VCKVCGALAPFRFAPCDLTRRPGALVRVNDLVALAGRADTAPACGPALMFFGLGGVMFFIIGWSPIAVALRRFVRDAGKGLQQGKF